MRISKRWTCVPAILLCVGLALPAKPDTNAKPADPAKQAVSKACSDQAAAKGLHGKPRKAFRSQCKKNGGKAV